jgi:hypothetical protein
MGALWRGSPDHPEMVNRLILVNTFASLRPKSLGVWLYFRNASF